MEKLVIGGKYRHYKGMEYKVHGVVKHSETLEDLILYETLYDNPQGKMWVRPMQMFLETVVIEGVPQPRFKFIG